MALSEPRRNPWRAEESCKDFDPVMVVRGRPNEDVVHQRVISELLLDVQCSLILFGDVFGHDLPLEGVKNLLQQLTSFRYIYGRRRFDSPNFVFCVFQFEQSQVLNEVGPQLRVHLPVLVRVAQDVLSDLVSQDVQRAEAANQCLQFCAALRSAFEEPVSILNDALYERGLLAGGTMCLDFDEAASPLHPKQGSLEDLIR